MNRSYSYPAQVTFDLVNRLQSLSTDSSRIIRLFARAASRVTQPLSRRLLLRRIVKARLYGHTLLMPSEHPLPMTLQAFPQCNRSLGLAVEAIGAIHANNSPITVIDVGANIGETVAIIEQRMPGACSYLCIEADENIAELCRLNYAGNHRIEVKQCFIGEDEGSLVWLEDDGRANSSTKLATEPHVRDETSFDRLVRLDTVAHSFAETHGHLSLIKVDTEGYDFSVLRSSSGLLSKYRPKLYFEWFPKLLTGLNEEVWGGFEFLEKFGYRHFVFFTSQGNFYCEISDPDRFFLSSLARVTEREGAFEYFDVFASTSEEVCNELTERSLT
jgi:FkbM family methyltransferase